ncbi:MAG: NPCBM/NEW2 domain-containing protein [Phycisphaeraceae bacterium]
MMRSNSLVATVLLCCALTTAAIAQSTDRAATLDGDIVTGVITAISKEGSVTVNDAAGTDSARQIDLMRLRHIERGQASTNPNKPTLLIYQIHGGIIRAESIVVADQKMVIDWVYGKGLTLPLSAVRGVLLTPPDGWPKTPLDESFQASLQSPSPQHDRLYVATEKNVQSLDGLLQSLDDQEARVLWENQVRPIARGKLYGVVFAKGAATSDPTGLCRLTMKDGSIIWGKVDQMADGELSLTLTPDCQVTLPWNEVMRLDVRSDRMMFLSDLNPVEVTQEAIVTFNWPWRRDAGVLGQTMQLGGKTYDKGLGVHARNLLTFENNGFDRLVAVIGLQPQVKGKGDCEFVVLGDGAELFRQRMRGSDDPKSVNVKVRGVKRVTLAVEPGEDLDLADDANWADARFIKD